MGPRVSAHGDGLSRWWRAQASEEGPVPAPGRRKGATRQLGSQKPGRGGSPERSAQSRLNTPVSPATTMAASSQPAKVNPNDAHAAQPSATKLSRCLKFTTGNSRSMV